MKDTLQLWANNVKWSRWPWWGWCKWLWNSSQITRLLSTTEAMSCIVCDLLLDSDTVAALGHKWSSCYLYQRSSFPLLDNVWVMVIVWRLWGNIIRTALCWIVWHNVHSQQHTYMSSSYRSNRFGLSHCVPYTVRRGSCLELYYCNMVKWFWWDSSLISTTIWFPSVLWHGWFGHPACKNRLQNDLQCVEWHVKPLLPLS